MYVMNNQKAVYYDPQVILQQANIGGVQQARVARDEVIIPRNRVQAMGGSQRLYDLMNQAHEARRVADRGEDTGLARGLMAV